MCSTREDLNTNIKSYSLNEGARRVAVAELIVRRAKNFYNKTKEITELCAVRNDIKAVVFDLMQHLPLALSPLQKAFFVNCGLIRFKNK